MRVTGPNRRRFFTSLTLLVVTASALTVAPQRARAQDPPPFYSLSKLATALSENDPDTALEFFDPKMEGFAQIEQNLEALTSQSDISCSIDIVSESETATDGLRKLDLDWFFQLTSQADSNRLERRRERVQVEMRYLKNRWIIVSFSPLKILDPLSVR